MGEIRRFPEATKPRELVDRIGRFLKSNDSHIYLESGMSTGEIHPTFAFYSGSGKEKLQKFILHEFGGGSEARVSLVNSAFVSAFALSEAKNESEALPRRSAVIHAIGELREPRLVPILLEHLSHPAMTISDEAAESLKKISQMKEEAKPALPFVRKRLESRMTHWAMRYVLKFLSTMGPHASEALPELERFRNALRSQLKTAPSNTRNHLLEFSKLVQETMESIKASDKNGRK